LIVVARVLVVATVILNIEVPPLLTVVTSVPVLVDWSKESCLVTVKPSWLNARLRRTEPDPAAPEATGRRPATGLATAAPSALPPGMLATTPAPTAAPNCRKNDRRGASSGAARCFVRLSNQ
jgi:hypothetical protein